jgi:hypothetical protein
MALNEAIKGELVYTFVHQIMRAKYASTPKPPFSNTMQPNAIEFPREA